MGENNFNGFDLDKMAKDDSVMAEFLHDYISAADYSDLNLDGLTAEEIHQTGADYRNATHYKKTDLVLAKKYFQAAADRDCVAAWVDLGLMYYTDLIPNYEKALHWFNKAAEAGHSGAMFALGKMAESGHGAGKNTKKALRWYSEAAEAGNTEAWYLLGGKAFFGNVTYGGSSGADSSYDAFECYQKAADLGHCGAMYSLAKLYRNGDGIKENMEKAVEWLEKAVEAGNEDALDMLCEMYKKREIPNRKYKTGVQWLQDVPYGGEAAANYAYSYRNIDGEKKKSFSDYGKAVYWYEQAAAKGSINAMNELIELYSRGGKHGEKSKLPIDMKKAAHWVIKAAETGDPDAMLTYGLWLDPPDGMPCGGMPKDKAQSFEWLRKAADAGSADAMYQLGQAYSCGNGIVQKDLALAREWYEKAQAHGSDIAGYSINTIDEEIRGN